MRYAAWVVHKLLQGSPRFRTPQTQRRDLFGLVNELDLGEAYLVDHALHPHVIAVASIATADHAEAVLGQAHNCEIRMDATCAVKEVRVNALADRRAITDPGH